MGREHTAEGAHQRDDRGVIGAHHAGEPDDAPAVVGDIDDRGEEASYLDAGQQ